jgi:hypothetical protein
LATSLAHDLGTLGATAEHEKGVRAGGCALAKIGIQLVNTFGDAVAVGGPATAGNPCPDSVPQGFQALVHADGNSRVGVPVDASIAEFVLVDSRCRGKSLLDL